MIEAGPRFRVIITFPSGKRQVYKDTGYTEFNLYVAGLLARHLSKRYPKYDITMEEA